MTGWKEKSDTVIWGGGHHHCSPGLSFLTEVLSNILPTWTAVVARFALRYLTPRGVASGLLTQPYKSQITGSSNKRKHDFQGPEQWLIHRHKLCCCIAPQSWFHETHSGLTKQALKKAHWWMCRVCLYHKNWLKQEDKYHYFHNLELNVHVFTPHPYINRGSSDIF